MIAQPDRAADEAVDQAERRRAAPLAAKAEAEARKRHDDSKGGPDGGAGGDLRRHHVAAKPDGAPKPGAQRNFTDPQSRIMVKGDEVLPGYSA